MRWDISPESEATPGPQPPPKNFCERATETSPFSEILPILFGAKSRREPELTQLGHKMRSLSDEDRRRQIPLRRYSFMDGVRDELASSTEASNGEITGPKVRYTLETLPPELHKYFILLGN